MKKIGRSLRKFWTCTYKSKISATTQIETCQFSSYTVTIVLFTVRFNPDFHLLLHVRDNCGGDVTIHCSFLDEVLKLPHPGVGDRA